VKEESHEGRERGKKKEGRKLKSHTIKIVHRYYIVLGKKTALPNTKISNTPL